MSHTHHHVRNGSAPCAHPWSREASWARRLTRRALRRAQRAWLRSDVDVEGVEPFESDEHAVCAVARVARCGALLFDVESGATLMLDTKLGAEGSTVVRADVRTRMERQIEDGDRENDGHKPRWICIVPRMAAQIARVL